MSDVAAQGRHVFLVRSSLQYLLATALATELREPSRMLFLPDLLDPQLFVRAAQDWAESPFDRVLLIEPRRRSLRNSAAVRHELESALLDARPLSLTVFNDREEPGQTALIAVARHFPLAQRHCAEDGALAYTSFAYRRHSVATRLRQTLRLGRRWSDVRVLGTHPLVQRFVALHPSLLRPELRRRAVDALPQRALEAPALRSLANRLCAFSGFAPDSIPAGAVLLTLSHSGYAERNPAYRELVRACVDALGAHRERLFVKYHPRESQDDYLVLCTHGATRQIPRTLPVESLYLMLRHQPLTVVGGMSTALLTAGMLMPQVRCAALVHASAAGDAWDGQLLDALHITPLPDTAAVRACFEADMP